MKRFAVAALVAVTVALASQHKASAQGGWYWKGNIGVNFSWDAVMGCYGVQGPPTHCGYANYAAPAPAPYYAPAPYGYAYDASASYPGYAIQSPAAAPAQQATTPAAAQPAPATTTQIGYYPYAYSYGYYGYQAPSYWYGR
jgi:hypothetical protein